MLIVCPACVSSYRIDPANLGGPGVPVRCAQCHSVWTPDPRGPATGAWRPAEVGTGPEPRGPLLGQAMALGVRTRARPAIARPPMRSGERSAFGPILAAILVIGLGMATIAGRETIARAVPAAEPLFAAMGLPTDQAAAQNSVSTRTASIAAREAPPPTITAPDQRVIVRQRSEQRASAWSDPAPQASQASHEAISFGTKPAAKRPDGDLQVSFAESSGSGRLVRVKDR